MVALGLLGIWILGASLTSPLLGLGNAICKLSRASFIDLFVYSIGIDTTEIAEAWLVIAQASST